MDVLNADFVERYAEATGARIKRSMWGAGWCSLLSDELRRMYKARLLQRVAVGLSSGSWQPGFPKWVYSYRLSGIGIEALGELPGEDVA
ncbi:conserved hypothetical protein [Xanthomonas citri pv. citri]|nr:conserved hypothetical protein [Xanthomonas citri pv. citri]